MKIEASVTIDAPLSIVWDTYVNPDDIVQWNAASDDWHTTASTVDLRPGGKFLSRMEAKDGSFGFDFEGIYTEVVPGQLLVYSFGDRVASVRFEDTSDGVAVTVEFDAEEENSLEDQRSGWQAILENFARHVAGK